VNYCVIVVFTFYRLVEWQINLQSRDRSKSFDEKNFVKLPGYKGDNVNKEPDDKENNVKRQNFLLSSYKRDKGQSGMFTNYGILFIWFMYSSNTYSMFHNMVEHTYDAEFTTSMKS
jgi:hypothetical protein